MVENANREKTGGDLDDFKPGWLARARKARRERVRKECVEVWRHEASHQHKLRRAERAGAVYYEHKSEQKSLKEGD
jgi:hypothetical protein